jgi:hypothetical protein
MFMLPIYTVKMHTHLLKICQIKFTLTNIAKPRHDDTFTMYYLLRKTIIQIIMKCISFKNRNSDVLLWHKLITLYCNIFSPSSVRSEPLPPLISDRFHILFR